MKENVRGGSLILLQKALISEIEKITDEMMSAFDTLCDCKNRLDEIACKAYAKKLDTITGKLYNLTMHLCDKARN